jgi:predicted metal-dependent hydrolase
MSEPVINERERTHAAQLVAAGTPIPQWWFRRSAMLTFLFNASSTTVPEGERFIIRAARDARDFTSDEGLKKRAETLMHEEAAHARMHDAYNRYLDSLGLPTEKYYEETKRLIQFLEKRFSLMGRLAVCTMIEHFTAIFSKQVLDTGILEGEDVDERMDRVWSWHCIEEVEHRSTAFDLYLALGGGYFTRIGAAWLTSVLFAYMHTRCLFAFLAAKKALWKWNTWRYGLPYVFGPRGVYHLFLTDWIRFFKPGFHPYQIPIANRYHKQLHHYHIEEELVGYFPPEPASVV